MESLTGKDTRKRKSNEEGDKDSVDVSKKSKVFALQTKEIIPDVFRNSVTFSRKRIPTEVLTPDEVEVMKNIPCDTEAALMNLRSTFPVEIFGGRLPPVFLYSQLTSLVFSRAKIDWELKKLASENKILTFSLFSSNNYLIVFYSDFVALKRDGVIQRFVNEVLGAESEKTPSEPGFSSAASTSKDNVSLVGASGIKRSTENSKLISKESLRKKWKFEEDEVRQLVNTGYLGVQEGSYYCISLPSAGEFIKMYEKGKKTIINSIKRAKFGEILQKELEQRPMKKTAPLGVAYHIFDLLGSGDVVKVDTTSGPLLRIKRELPS